MFFCNSTVKSGLMQGKYVLIWVAFGMFSCATAKFTNHNIADKHSVIPDYSKQNHWAAHPAKWDFSDSLPKPYRPLEQDTTIDVFFIYPTSYLNGDLVDEQLLYQNEEIYRWNADIMDLAINQSTDKGSMLYQASAFNQYRVFAPRYRQAHIKTFYIEDSIAKMIFDVAYQDVKKSFMYYLQYQNNGRPFIIASHSQGTLHGARLIKEMIEGKPIQKKMVAAYLLGLPVKEDYFSGIAPCANAEQTGCVISWRTFKMGYVPAYVMKETFEAIVVNPLTWTLQPEKAERKLNKGAVLYNFNKPKPASVSTVIHGNILWSSKPRFFGNLFFTRKNYHVGDINLFWKDIRDNAAQRVKAYKLQNN
jgi:hypothetical protein